MGFQRKCDETLGAMLLRRGRCSRGRSSSRGSSGGSGSTGSSGE